MLYCGHAAIIPDLHSRTSQPVRSGQGHRLFRSHVGQDPACGGGEIAGGMAGDTGHASKRSFDSRCCKFLHIDYAALDAETLKGGSDEELLAWAFVHGRQPSEEEIEVWNGFMTKYGWRDAGTQRLHERLAEIGLPPGTVQTMFEFIDLDEGRRQAGPR